METPRLESSSLSSSVRSSSDRRPGQRLVLLSLLASLALGACVDTPADPLAVEETAPTSASEEAALALFPPPPPVCQDGVIPGTGALVRACVPAYGWNGDLVVWAHGYVAPMAPLAIPTDEVGGQSVEGIVAGLGYGYATTSYRDNGLVAADGVDDLDDARGFFEGLNGPAGQAYLIGASEGGLASALSLERSAPGYDAGMVLCAPVGSFKRQIEYFGNFRVLMDAYFPGLVDDGSAATPWIPWGAGGDVVIAPGVQANWDAIAQAVAKAAATQPRRMAELLRVAGVAVDLADPTTVVQSALGVLWYNIFATNDAISKLGGNPFGNALTWYRGSSNDWRLNRTVQRIAADPSAVQALAPFETDGSLEVPGVGMHTTLDPVIPFSQGLSYRFETLLAGVGFAYNFLPIRSYGHCAFEAPQVLAGFSLMVLKARGFQLFAPSGIFSDGSEEATFLSAAREMGADPVVVRKRDRR